MPLSVAGRWEVQGPLRVSSATVHVVGEVGSEIDVRSSGIGLHVTPRGVEVGTVAAAAGAAAVQVVGLGTTGVEVGQWLRLSQPAGLDGPAQSRRVTGVAGDLVTLEHPLGRALPPGSTVTAFAPLDRLVLEDLTLRRTGGAGGATLVVQYCRDVTLRRVTVLNETRSSEARGNGISVYQADRVRLESCRVADAGQIGVFVYDSDDVQVSDCVVNGWRGLFAVQLKDCRDAVVQGLAAGAGGEGRTGLSLKCSGLNPARDVRGAGCRVRGSRLNAYELTSIGVEGQRFAGERFSFADCEAADSGTNGFATVVDGSTVPQDWSWSGCRSVGAGGSGFVAQATAVRISDCSASDSGGPGMRLSGPGVRVTGGRVGNNQLRGATSPGSAEIEVTDGSATISAVTFTGGGGADQPVLALPGVPVSVDALDIAGGSYG